MKFNLFFAASAVAAAVSVAQGAVVINNTVNSTGALSGTFSNGGFLEASDSFTGVSYNVNVDSIAGGFQTKIYTLDGATEKAVLIFDILGSLNSGTTSGQITIGGNPVNFSYSFAGGDPMTGSYSFTAVPEPSEYAAIAGAGLVGFAAWRRSRKNLA